eukprot:8376684-Pyramimonas_sp.AAC.1
MIHVFCPFWRSYLRVGLVVCGSEFDPPDWAYGGIRSCRREALMMIIKILIWKCLHCKLGFMLKSYDMRNAFGTGHVLGLVQAQEERQPTIHFRRVLEHYRAQAIIRIDAADSTVHVHPTSGGRMGDSNEPELFMQAFYKPI